MTLDDFTETFIHHRPGHLIPVSVARALFLATLPTKAKYDWDKVNFSQQLWALGYETGYGTANRSYIINTSFDPRAKYGTPWILHGERRLRREVP